MFVVSVEDGDGRRALRYQRTDADMCVRVRPSPEPLSDPTGKSAAEVSTAMRKLNPATLATAYQVLSTHPQPLKVDLKVSSRLTSTVEVNLKVEAQG